MVGVHHQPDQLLEARPRLPPEIFTRLGGVPDQVIHLGGAHQRLVEHDSAVDLKTSLVEGDLQALAHRVRRTRGDHVVLGLLTLEHQPHRLHVVLRIPPVAFGVEVAEVQLLHQTKLDRSGVPGDLARHELQRRGGATRG